MDERLHRLQQEMVSLRSLVRDSEQKERRKQDNAKKQYGYVKRLEKLLLDNGYAGADELEEYAPAYPESGRTTSTTSTPKGAPASTPRRRQSCPSQKPSYSAAHSDPRQNRRN